MTKTFGFRVSKEEAEILNAFLKWAQEDFGYDTKADTMKKLLLQMAHNYAIPNTGGLKFPAPKSQQVK